MIKRAIMLFVLVISMNSLAQEKMNLTLQQSVSMALEKNPELQAAQKEVDKASAAVWEARANILPSVNASVNFQKAWNIQETTIPNFIKMMMGPAVSMIPALSEMPDYVRISFGLENTFTYGANLQQPLFLGGAGWAGVQMAGAGKRAAEQTFESKKQNLIYNTTAAFYGCILAKQLVQVQEEALAQAQANLDIVKKKHDVGMASGFDKMRAEVEVANLKPEVISARNNLQLALTQLRNVLGLERTVELDVQGELAFQNDEYANMSLADFQKLALQSRPEMKALSEQVYITHKGITVARSAFMPKLFFTTDYSFLAMRNDYNFRDDDFSKGFTSALSLQIPLFHGFKNTKGYQKARLDYRIMLDTEKQVRDGVAAEAEMTFNKFQEAKQKYQAAQESISLAQEALRLANLMYEEGASTQLDVLSAQLAKNRAQLNYISSTYEYQMARYALRKVTGALTSVL
jgi:outer membrane protein TolC